MSSDPKASSPSKSAKVQLRLWPVQKETIAQAARIKQTTLTGFMVEHALSAAQEVLAEQTHFELPPERWEAFCEALDRPPKPIPALRNLLAEKDAFDAD